MSTNFYTGNEEEKELIHIAKTSEGWVPVFEFHRGIIESVKDIKRFCEASGLSIFNEYGFKYNWEEFQTRVVEHCPDGKSHLFESAGHVTYKKSDDGYEFIDGEFF